MASLVRICAVGFVYALLTIGAFAAEIPLPRYVLGSQGAFWTWDLSVMPPGFRRISATAAAVGKHSYIFVENSLWSDFVRPEHIANLSKHLEQEGMPDSPFAQQGILPLEERIFAPLPQVVRPDPRLVVLIARLGSYQNHTFDGFFNPFDQLSEADAWAHSQQHSNETNIIYINASSKNASSDGADFNAHHAASIISHELQHLLAYHARGASARDQEVWLSETAAESAMLFAGYYTDQSAVNFFANKTWAHSLVTQSYVHYGLPLLFSAFLIDRLGNYGGFDQITKIPEIGRQAVERVYQDATGIPASFDSIFSEFICYIINAVSDNSLLPGTWSHPAGSGIQVPRLAEAGQIRDLPYKSTGEIALYTFAVYGLSRELPPAANVELRLLDNHDRSIHVDANCADPPQLLWKPLPRAIIVYAVGCAGPAQNLRYEISIQDAHER